MKANIFEELAKLSEAIIELPFATARRMLKPESEREAQAAGWKAYDAWVRLMNAATDQFYSNAAFGAATGHTMDRTLRWQRMGTASSAALFSGVWPVVGLPTAAEMSELHADVRALRDEVAASRVEAEEAGAAGIAMDPATRVPVNDSLAAMWDGWFPAPVPHSVSKVREDASAN